MSVNPDHFLELAKRREEEIEQGIRPTPELASVQESTDVQTEDVSPGPEEEDVFEELRYQAKRALQTLKMECRERDIQSITLTGHDRNDPVTRALAEWFWHYMLQGSALEKGERVFTKGVVGAITELDPTIDGNRAQPLKTAILAILEDEELIFRRWPQDRRIVVVTDDDPAEVQRRRQQARQSRAAKPAKEARPDPVKRLIEASRYTQDETPARDDAQMNRETIERDLGGPPVPPVTVPVASMSTVGEQLPPLGATLTVVGFRLDAGRIRIDLQRNDGSDMNVWLD